MATSKSKAKVTKSTKTAKTKSGTVKKPASKAAKQPARPAAKTKRKVLAIPKGYRSLTPYLVVRDAAAALDFYAKAFGAKEKVRMAMPDGSVMHAEIQIGDSMLMLSEENPTWGAKSPLLLGGSAAHVMIYTKDVDAFVARAVAAGCTIEFPITNQFWGDRYGRIKDPYGHQWSVGTHVEDVGPKEMERRVNEAGKQMASSS